MEDQREAVYDEKIQPLMAQILEICKEEKIACLFSFLIGKRDPYTGAASNLKDLLNTMCVEEYEHGLKMGWERNTDGEGLMLIVTELAEAMEDIRNGKDVTDMYFEGDKPCGVPSELADVVIRVASYCGFRGIDLGAAVEAKRAYNKTRAFRHGGKLL